MTHDRLLRSFTLALLFASVLSLPEVSVGQTNARRRSWSSDYRSSLATAQRQDRPLMVVFRCVP